MKLFSPESSDRRNFVAGTNDSHRTEEEIMTDINNMNDNITVMMKARRTSSQRTTLKIRFENTDNVTKYFPFV